MIRATSILAALSFAAIAGAQPAKPAKATHDSTKAKLVAPAASHAAAPAAAPAAAAVPAAMHAAAPVMKHDTTKKAAAKLKKPGV